MPKTDLLAVRVLKLDLGNYRTVRQPDEQSAIKAMISIKPDWFWALTLNLLDEGYHPTENILILCEGKRLVVKEGNRRIAALKLALGYASSADISVPSDVQDKIDNLSKEWKSANRTVPCAIYEASEEGLVDRIVALTHAKGEKAGRDTWKAIAKARHNRDKNSGAEYGLDILEKYLKSGSNVTPAQAERWAGDYQLTVLDEAIKKLAPRIGYATSKDLAHAYPKINPYKTKMEKLLQEIGLDHVSFADIRNDNFLFNEFGFPYPAGASSTAASSATTKTQGGSSTGKPSTSGTPSAAATKSASTSMKAVAFANNDPRSVIRDLRAFKPKGPNRNKLVTLLEEAKGLNISKSPHAFCFILRSMFELSAKAYCDDHAQSNGPKTKKANGDDRALAEMLRDITNHLTNNKQNRALVKVLHGAMAELATSEGFLSVTSFNQLVHNPKFSVAENHISTLFSNIFPLLSAMNS